MSQYLDWHVGMKVVCVADPARIAAGMRVVKGSRYPQSGGVYTIREIRDDALYRGDGIVLLLAEVDNGHLIGTGVISEWWCYVEPGFSVRGFRKLEPRKTSIAQFEAMLHSNRQTVDA